MGNENKVSANVQQAPMWNVKAMGDVLRAYRRKGYDDFTFEEMALAAIKASGVDVARIEDVKDFAGAAIRGHYKVARKVQWAGGQWDDAQIAHIIGLIQFEAAFIVNRPANGPKPAKGAKALADENARLRRELELAKATK